MFPPLRPPPFPFPVRLSLRPSPNPIPSTSTRSLHPSPPSSKRLKPQELFLRPGQTEHQARAERKAREEAEFRAKRDRNIKRIDLYAEAGFDTTDWGRNRIKKNEGMENWLMVRRMRLIAEGKLVAPEMDRITGTGNGRAADRPKAAGRYGRIREEDGPYGLRSGSRDGDSSWQQELDEVSWREDASSPDPDPHLDENGNPLPFGLRHKPTFHSVSQKSSGTALWSDGGPSTLSEADSWSSSWSDLKLDGSPVNKQAYDKAAKAVEEEKKLHGENPKLLGEVQRLLNLAGKQDLVADLKQRESSDPVTPAQQPTLADAGSHVVDRMSFLSESPSQTPPQPAPIRLATARTFPKAWKRNQPAEYNHRGEGASYPISPRSGLGWTGAQKGKIGRTGNEGPTKGYGLKRYSTDAKGGHQADRRAGSGRAIHPGRLVDTSRPPVRPNTWQNRKPLRPVFPASREDAEDPVYRPGRQPRDGAKWSPTKRLSRPAMAGLKQLHQQDPEKHDRFFLSKEFGISVEAVNRILRSDGRWQKKSRGGDAPSESDD